MSLEVLCSMSRLPVMLFINFIHNSEFQIPLFTYRCSSRLQECRILSQTPQESSNPHSSPTYEIGLSNCSSQDQLCWLSISFDERQWYKSVLSVPYQVFPGKSSFARQNYCCRFLLGKTQFAEAEQQLYKTGFASNPL